MTETTTPGRTDQTAPEAPSTAGPVSQALARAMQRYRREWETFRRQAFAELGLDGDAQIRALVHSAEALVRGAADLASDQSRPLEQALASLEDGHDPRHRGDPSVVVLAEALQYCLGREAVEMVAVAERRIWLLLLLTRQFQPGRRAAAFLRRVSRCYVYGFDPECAVMCRSVLEAAFETEVDDDACRRVLGQVRRPRRPASSAFDLSDRLAVARKLGRITEAAAVKAAAIRAAGNEVIHEHPRSCEDALPLIADTLDVIGELCRQEA